MAKNRRGMLIKNTNSRPVDIVLETRPIRLNPGEEKFITADEVRDNALREKLQVRAISIVRPSTQEEDEALEAQLVDQLGEEHAENPENR